MNDSPLPYKASPELKWLLNERAALVGLLTKSKQRAELLGRKISRYEQQIAVASEHRAAAERFVAEKSTTIAALDVAIAMANARIRPDAGGCVVPWKGKYGKRGGLSSFLKETLARAAPQPLSRAALTRLAQAHFGLALVTLAERESFRHTLKTVLRQAATKDGCVEKLETQGKSALYRWKGSTSLDALRTLSAALEASGHEPGDDSVRGEVAGQRTCGRSG